jgi:hypothetical protein
MHAPFQAAIPKKQVTPSTMRALVFRGPNQIAIEQVSIPRSGPFIRVTLMTSCGNRPATQHTQRRVPGEAGSRDRPPR